MTSYVFAKTERERSNGFKDSPMEQWFRFCNPYNP